MKEYVDHEGNPLVGGGLYYSVEDKDEVYILRSRPSEVMECWHAVDLYGVGTNGGISPEKAKYLRPLSQKDALSELEAQKEALQSTMKYISSLKDYFPGVSQPRLVDKLSDEFNAILFEREFFAI